MTGVKMFLLFGIGGDDDQVRKEGHYTTQTTFYEDGIELFSSPSFGFLYGDGQTRENTFSACDRGCNVQIFNMNDEIIRETDIGGDCFVDFKQVSDKYAIALTEEMCTYDPFTCIIYLEDFIFPKENMPNRAYDNARTPMPLTSDSGWLLFVPISAEKDGFRVKNIKTDEILENLVSYEDAYNNKFNWYETADDDDNNDNNVIFQNVLKHLGITEEQATEIMIQNNGTLSIPATEELFAAMEKKS
jgi:hypothetical protein